MYLTPENAPVGAVVVIRLYTGGIVLAEVKAWLHDNINVELSISADPYWADSVTFIARLDQPEPVKSSPDRLDAWPTVAPQGRWEYHSAYATTLLGVFSEHDGAVLFTTDDNRCAEDFTEFTAAEFMPGEYFTRVKPLTTTPGDSVTIERDRAAMDALRWLAEQNGWPTSGWLKIVDWLSAELSALRDFRAIGGDVSMAELERIVGDAVTVRTQICTAALQYGWKAGGLREWIELELEELAAWRIAAKTPMSKLKRLWRASERLPGEGDIVGWTTHHEHGICHPALCVRQTDDPNSYVLAMVAKGDLERFGACSSVATAPHPDLHPVKVDGVWRWQRK